MLIQRNFINANTPELILTACSALPHIRCATSEKNLHEIKEIRKTSIYSGKIERFILNTKLKKEKLNLLTIK